MNEGPNCRRKTVSPLSSDSLPSFFCSFRSALGPLLLPVLSLSASKIKVGPSSMYETSPEVEQRRSKDRNKGGARARKNSESPRKKKTKERAASSHAPSQCLFPFSFLRCSPRRLLPDNNNKTTTRKQNAYHSKAQDGLQVLCLWRPRPGVW